jgi:MFS family permease
LFLGSCLALISTSVAFGVITSMMGAFKSEFALSNTEAGLVGGAAIWGFTISIFIFGPLVDLLGMKRLLNFAFVGHLLGPLVMIFANGFGMLFAGGLLLAMANGTVEAVCNPLVATIFPTRKTQKLNQFHVWFPGGIVIGGLLAYLIDNTLTNGIGPLATWQIKLVLIFIPTIIYGLIFFGEKFPATERVQSGLSFGDMVRACLRPLFLLLFVCMGLTASLELGPGRWMGEVMNEAMAFAGAGAGILVLAYGNGLMAILRYFAGHAIDRFSPTGMLLISAVLAGIGLLALSFATGVVAVIACATIFYCGVCYFWPTMLGVAAERVPKGGALAMALLGGWGMAAVGLITTPLMGNIADHYGHQTFQVASVQPALEQGVAALRQSDAPGEVTDSVTQTLGAVTTMQSLPMGATADALREIVKYVPEDQPAASAARLELQAADDFGGKMSFRWVSSLSVVLMLVFGGLYLRDKAKGGYKAEHITELPVPTAAE